ncbi:hypothetical protein BD413DRAFT_622691 [Trametes elegans]|nr:hypothetical protein BD413DRAFT_622691 [Trametes elegans]
MPTPSHASYPESEQSCQNVLNVQQAAWEWCITASNSPSGRGRNAGSISIRAFVKDEEILRGCPRRRLSSQWHGRTRAASTRPAARSCQRRATPCTTGTAHSSPTCPPIDHVEGKDPALWAKRWHTRMERSKSSSRREWLCSCLRRGSRSGRR